MPSVVLRIALIIAALPLSQRSAADEFFENRIRPVLVEHCYECHATALAEPGGGLVLDHRAALRLGGESGEVIDDADPAASLLLKALRYESLEMPPAGKLPAAVIADFESWIRGGAVDPRDTPPSAAEATEAAWQAKLAQRRQWWSLQPPRLSEPPPLGDASGLSDPVDHFIRAALEANGLSPALPANAATLLRRLSFVLTGLPPEPEEVIAFETAFAASPSAAMSEWADRLMSSPHYGERLARHWMDVVRYTDTFGYEWDNPVKGSWEYRDYLIRAFRDDIGFDQLVREQIAGDLLETPRINPLSGLNESLIGPLFYHMGEHRHGSSLDFNGIHQEMIDNKIDAFSKTFLGITVACARCHDHKLDAVSQADYYALAGVFMTPRWTPRDLDASAEHAAAIEELKRLRAAITARLVAVWTRDAATSQRLSRDGLRAWAKEHRDALVQAKATDIGYPLGRLLTSTVWLPPEGNFTATATATSPATRLTPQADGSILAEGDVPEKDRYELRFATGPGIAGLLRLEALTFPESSQSDTGPAEPAQPQSAPRGPGRTEHGNFVLTDLRVEVTPRRDPAAASDAPAPPTVAVVIASATADFSQAGYPITAAFDGAPETGWAIGGTEPLNVDRTARFFFAAPVDLPHGGEWVVTLDQSYGSRHLLGRFRITLGQESGLATAASNQQAFDREAVARFAEDAARWRDARAAAKAANERFTVLAGFATPELPAGWVTDGLGMTHGHVSEGTLRISLSGETLVDSFLRQGYHTHALSSKLAGAVRLPQPEAFPKKMISLRLAGGEWAGRINIPQNAFHDEQVSFFDPAAAATWQAVTPRALSNGVTRVLTEISTASLHPNFPPRTGVARSGATTLPNDDLGRDKRSWFSLTGVVAHDEPGVPQDTLDPFRSLYSFASSSADDGSLVTIASTEEAWQRIVDWFAGALRRWADDGCQPGDVAVLNWLLQNGLLANELTADDELAEWVRRYREVESRIGFARSAMSMDERQIEALDYPLNVRGNVDDEGPRIERDFLEVFAGLHRVAESSGSGRRELADHLASGENPQVARVYVNRVWAWVFGTGLVATPNDFGKLGDPPSHPELLDRLAIEFMRDGWSTRRLIRRLVLSQTFQQSGQVNRLAEERDPGNRWWHHYPTRRLEAEAIRDSLLAVAGQLDRQLYGPPINPHRVAQDPAKRLFSGPLDGNGRRSIYSTMSIMEPPKFLVGFNLPDLKLPTGRRDVTNVPAQALILLNDPFVVAMARRWGERLVHDGATEIPQRIDRMFLAALGRHPDPDESQAWGEAARTLVAAGRDPLSDPEVWSELAHAFFNTKEFIYFR